MHAIVDFGQILAEIAVSEKCAGKGQRDPWELRDGSDPISPRITRPALLLRSVGLRLRTKPVDSSRHA